MLYRIRQPILHTRLENESVLLNLDSGRYFSLNSVGSRILSLLIEGPRTVEELGTNILREYPVSRETAEKDIRELIQNLVEHGLLETIDERAGS
jgi:hypothetical protein